LFPFYDISTPEIWKLTEVDEASPEIVFAGSLAGITCFKSTNVVVLAGIATEDKIATVSKLIVAVTPDVVKFAIAILVTTAVVDVFGAVYKVVLLVAAAPL
jgi:hypothetical protein